jgi:Transmembrane amino acid transporter protein
VVAESIIYTAAGILGYCIGGNQTPSLITEIKPLDSDWLIFKILMNAAVILIIVNMYVSIPMQQVPVRDMIIRFLKLKKENPLVLYPASMIFLSASALTAMVLTNIISILSIMGGFCSCFIVVFFPGMSYGLLSLPHSKCRAIFVLTVTLCITAVGLTSCLLVALRTLGLINLES